MRSQNQEFSVENVFKGISEKEMSIVKSLIPADKVTYETLNTLISELSPSDQWLIDNYLEKARTMQRIRLYVKKALIISLVIVTIILDLLLIILIKG